MPSNKNSRQKEGMEEAFPLNRERSGMRTIFSFTRIIHQHSKRNTERAGKRSSFSQITIWEGCIRIGAKNNMEIEV